MYLIKGIENIKSEVDIMSTVWIIVILAVVVGLIVIVSKKKTPKSAFSSDFDFGKGLDEAQNNRNALVAQAKPNDEDYGYSPNNPIMVSPLPVLGHQTATHGKVDH